MHSQSVQWKNLQMKPKTHLCQTNKAPLNASIMVEQGGEDELAMPMKIAT